MQLAETVVALPVAGTEAVPVVGPVSTPTPGPVVPNAFSAMMAASASTRPTTAAAAPQSNAFGQKRSAAQPAAARAPPPLSRSLSPPPQPTLRYVPGPVPLDLEAAQHWLYPTRDEYPIRQYQLEMTETALFHNTLVSLPTGLGKTLIAAAVLHNFHRWFPTGITIFLAPTNPLVNQQVQACGSIVNLPAKATAVLTGHTPQKRRAELWQSRHVFFCTPQTVQRDLEVEGVCPAQNVVALVLDEAHKATGEYAYVRVVRLLEEAGARFRIVGLSATPGANIKAIQEVVDVLRISKIDARGEQDPSVAPYIHSRHSEIVRVPQASAVHDVERAFTDVFHPHLERLAASAGGLGQRLLGNPSAVSGYQILLLREDLARRDPDACQRLQGHLHVAQTFAQLRDKLRRHGADVVRAPLHALRTERQRGLLCTVIKEPPFQRLCDAVAKANGVDPASSTSMQPFSLQDRLTCNPKLAKLLEILTEHFERAKVGATSSSSTRAIVFSQFRDSVSEIVKVLRSSEPLIRPRQFIGQGKGGKQPSAPVEGSYSSPPLKGMKQSEQRQVIQQFRSDVYNVLVCTCIGEEGLDIGEVDLIVNFDTLRNPIRMIQRVGRTGRKREGRVVCLVGEGSEEKNLSASRVSERNLVHALKNPNSFKCHPSVPMFPSPPERKEWTMRASQSFHISQVMGHDTRKLRADVKKPATPPASLRDWRLSASENEARMRMLGESANMHIAVEDRNFPPVLLRHFLAARESMGPSNREPRNSVRVGRTIALLRTLESTHPIPHRVCRVAPSRSGDNLIGQLFAFNNFLEANRKPLDDIQPFGRQADLSFGNSAFHDNRDVRVELGLGSIEHPVASSVPVPSPGTRLNSQGPLTLLEFHRSTDHDSAADLAVSTSRSTQNSMPILPTHSASPPVAMAPNFVANNSIASGASAESNLHEFQEEDVFVLPTQPDDASISCDERSHCSAGKAHVGTEHLDHRAFTEVCNQHESSSKSPQPESLVIDDAYRLPSDNDSFSEDEGPPGDLIESSAEADRLHHRSSAAACEQHDSSSKILVNFLNLDSERLKQDDAYRLQLDENSITGDEGPRKAAAGEQHSSSSKVVVDFPNQQSERLQQDDAFRLPSDDSSSSSTSSSVASDTRRQVKPRSDDAFAVRGGEDVNRAVSTEFFSSNASDMNDPDRDDDRPLPSRKWKRETIESDASILSSQPVPVVKEGSQVEGHIADKSSLVSASDGAATGLVARNSRASPHRVRFSLGRSQTESAAPRLYRNAKQPQMMHCPPLEDTPVGPAPPRPVRTQQLGLEDTPTSPPTDSLLFDESLRRRLPDGNPDSLSRVDDICCCICRSGDSPDDDPIILCDGPADCVPCPVAVHMSCYSVPKEVLAEEVWRCDLCQFFYEGGVGRVVCYECGRDDNNNRSKGGVLKRLEHDVWHHVGRCCIVDVEEERAPKGRKRLRRIGVAVAGSGATTSTAAVAGATAAKKKRRRPLNNLSTNTNTGAPPLPPMPRGFAADLPKPAATGRISRYCKFIDSEAGIDSDSDADGDADEEDDLAALEEEEEAMAGFINDSSQLGYSQYTPDPLDKADPDGGCTAASSSPNDEAALHRRYDMARERDTEFDTPILNRRLLHRKRDRDGDGHDEKGGGEWTDTTPPSAASSERGLGKLHFVRSVVEHHRQGGHADEIESVYEQLEAEAQATEPESDGLRPARPPSTRTVMLYEPSESEEE